MARVSGGLMTRADTCPALELAVNFSSREVVPSTIVVQQPRERVEGRQRESCPVRQRERRSAT